MPPLLEPKRLRILRALQVRLARIRQADGYHTDAGYHVALGRYRIPTGVALEAVLPAIAITVGRTNTPAQGVRIQTDLPVIVQAIVAEDYTDALAQAELAVSDIKRALFGPLTGPVDETLGGLVAEMEPGEVEPIPREEGSPFAGLQVELLLKLTEKRGEPES